MTANTVNGSGNGARSGAQTLTLLSRPLNCLILRSLADGPKQQATLRRQAGSPAQTTLRAQLKRLAEVGAIVKHRRNRFPGVLEYELTASGRDLLFVATVLERWLSRAPEGPLPFGSNAAKAAIKALVEGWSTSMLRALAARPLSLTELDSVIGSLSYPALERRLGAMRLSGQVEACPANGRGTPYGVTNWVRSGVAPLIAAVRWEQRHQPGESPPPTSIDVEAAFLLAVPLLRCPDDLTGACQMAVVISGKGKQRLAGIAIEIVNGRIAACSTRLRMHPDTSAAGPLCAWLSAVIDAPSGELNLSGDRPLAHALLTGLHEVLFENALDVNEVIGKDRSN
ncbi:MAG TPA: winged helix-turn-helix transcriptional regulator [Solirubrobacterales bacterium]|nr:winged helix-turn-helix transcriptional regulator [Solirubrobacterales bacterium]